MGAGTDRSPEQVDEVRQVGEYDVRAGGREFGGVVGGADPDDVPDARVQGGADPRGRVLRRQCPCGVDARCPSDSRSKPALISGKRSNEELPRPCR